MIADELWPGGPKFIKGNAFPLGTDSVLLASFAEVSGALRACDLGCGAGIIALLLALNNPKLHVDGVEIQSSAAETARLNSDLNGLSDRLDIITGDICKHREFLTAGAYDLVISNPPYFVAGSGYSATGDGRTFAREEKSCTLKDICTAAAYLTRWGGKFALVHRPERLSEVFCTLSAAGLEPKRLRFVQHKAQSAPNLFLIEARRGGKASMVIEPPLVLANNDGTDTDEIKEIYHRR